eukprot:5665323-Pyramimonas_sp.AAC.1
MACQRTDAELLSSIEDTVKWFVDNKALASKMHSEVMGKGAKASEKQKGSKTAKPTSEGS